MDFSHYKSYSWLKAEAGNPLWPDRIRSAVDAQLAAGGMTQAPSGGDASVAAFGSTHTQPPMETFYTCFGGGWFWRGFGDGMSTTTCRKYTRRHTGRRHVRHSYQEADLARSSERYP